MRGKKKLHQNRVEPGKEKAKPVETLQNEPTIRDWHVLLDRNVEQETDIHLTIQLLMLSSPSGRAYLDYVTRYRPELRTPEAFDFLELVITYEARDLLERLLAEPRCGTDPHFFIWKEVWNDGSLGASYRYVETIKIAQEMEAHLTDEDERERLRLVRQSIERELFGEIYIECKRELTKAKNT